MKIKRISEPLNPTFIDVKSWYEKHLHPDANDYDDQKVYEYVYHQGNFAGIFQLTSSGAQRLFKAAKPRSIVDIAVLTSIYRPGPLAASVDKIYLDARKGKKFEWGHPLFEQVLGKTDNCLIFQESVMDLAEHIGGFPKDMCDNVRRAIMKRDLSKGDAAKAEAKKMEDDFVAGAVSKGVKEETARKAYQNILYYAGYGFNKCVTSDSEIYTYQKNGDTITPCKKLMKAVTPGDFVMSRDEKTRQNVLVKVKNVHHNGKKKVIQVKLKSGETIKCTLDHKFRTQETGEMLPLHQIIAKGLSIVVNSSHTIVTGATKASNNEDTKLSTLTNNTSKSVFQVA